MKDVDERDQQIVALRNRLSKLSAASLRINESLDLDTVLQEILDSARSLTNAEYGVIAIFDDAGQVEDFLASGLTADETQQLREATKEMTLCKISGTMESPGLCQLHQSAGHSRVPPAYGDEFLPSSPDSPARAWAWATFIWPRANPARSSPAKTKRPWSCSPPKRPWSSATSAGTATSGEPEPTWKRLINTSPVGVVVLDARTGVPVSFNREVRRIIGGLQTPGSPVEQLLDMVTVRRADGREIGLAEYPIAQALSTGETVRAEEIVIQVPDGRSVTTVVNATPIRSQDGEIESVVVTLQDMTPLEELERLRAEFLGMVSHELRVPLSSIRGSATALLDASSGLNPAERQFLRIIINQTDHMGELIDDLLDVARIKTGTLPVSPEPAEIASLVDRARNTFLSGGGKNDLDFDLTPDLPLVMADRQRIVQVLGNLLSNAAKYSPASSIIRVTAVREDFHVAVTVADEGIGISAERLPHLFRKFSRTDGETEGSGIGGSGLGLAICKGIVEAHGGRIWAESDGPGQGARFTFTIPMVEEAETDAAQLAARSRQEAREDVRILVVDDDPAGH